MKTFGRYEVEETIGKGAMGIVYRCKDPQIGRSVAVKTLLVEDEQTGEELRERMLREARAAGVLSHPNIVTVFDVGEDSDTVYIVMEYLEGNPLDAVIREGRPIQPREVLKILEQVGGALDYAHARSIVHRDVKPANIMLTSEPRAVLMDFGIAWMFDPSVTEKGALIGSPIYMSPEQIDGQDVDGKADIYSLGAVVFELLTAHRPFAGDSFNEVVQLKYENRRIPISSVNNALPGSLESFFDRALAPDAAARFGSCDEMLTSLRSAIYQSPGAGFYSGAQSPLQQTARENMPATPSQFLNSNPHMAETMMVNRQTQPGKPLDSTQVMESESIRYMRQVEQQRQDEDTAPQQQEDVQTQPSAGAGAQQSHELQQTSSSREAESYKLNLPKLNGVRKKAATSDTQQEIKKRASGITFQRPEDLTVSGQRKLVQELKSVMQQLERKGENLEDLLRAGQLFVRLGKHSDAMLYFKRCLKISWECSEAYASMAQVYSEFKMQDKADNYWAIAEWLSEREVGRFSAEDGYRLGKKLEDLKLIRGALTIWEEVCALQPWHLDAWKELARYYLQMKDYRKALGPLQHIVELSKYDSLAWRNLAVCYQNTKDYYKALNAWEKAARLEPKGEGGIRAQKQIANLKRFLKMR